jgi:hypothetical protein
MVHHLGLKGCLLYRLLAPRLPIPFCFWVGRSVYKGKTIVYVDSSAPGISRYPSPWKDLRDLRIKEGGLLQYVDDFLICSLTQDIPNANTDLALNFLADMGYKISKTKGRFSLQEVHYPGYILMWTGAWRLSAERIEVICTLTIPLTKHKFILGNDGVLPELDTQLWSHSKASIWGHKGVDDEL